MINLWTHFECLIQFQSPLKSVKLEDIINYINSDIVIIKIDIEGYECKALQPNVLLNKLGKFIPYIFMEWRHIYNNTFGNCPHTDFSELVHLFDAGGYIPFNPGEEEINDLCFEMLLQERWNNYMILTETK